MSYAAFSDEIAKVNDILCAVAVLGWDSRTKMPESGAETRGKQIATLMGLARDLATGDVMLRAIEGARAELAGVPASDLKHRAVADAAAAVAVLSKIPGLLVTEMADHAIRAEAVWMRARAGNDFALFAPYLERTMEMKRHLAELIGYADHPYDANVALYEPGSDWTRLRALFADLEKALKPLLEQAMSGPRPRVDILERSYDVETQRVFSRRIAEQMGYDFSRGRLDDTAHPFATSFTSNDVRITGRFMKNWLPSGMFGIWHESGHAMYEQGIAPAFTRTIFATDLVGLDAMGGAGLGIHESQSRLWENRIGRSRRFWELHFGELKAAFPDQLADVTAGDFWRAVNAARPSLIRVEADELTYDFHIILRAEIEAGLMAGDLMVADLPAIWRDKMRATLGIEVPTDSDGVLQDIHWAGGMVGYFPSYTVGNIAASQLFKAASCVPAVSAGLDAGDYQPLKGWLNENVHRHGRSLTPGEIIEKATGKPLDIADYVADLSEKAAMLAS